MWHYIPDPTPPPYGFPTGCNPMKENEDPLKTAKAAVRYYKSIIAEESRKKDSEEKKKKETVKVHWWNKITKTHLATFLFFTWWTIPLYLLWTIQFLKHALEATIK